jgi:hypothetical protein
VTRAHGIGAVVACLLVLLAIGAVPVQAVGPLTKGGGESYIVTFGGHDPVATPRRALAEARSHRFDRVADRALTRLRITPTRATDMPSMDSRRP